MDFIKRFYIYQKERFPLIGHGLLITVFTFSAISYSLVCRGETQFIDFRTFAQGVFMTMGFFFLLRVFDEFKDKEEDAKYRPHLPVPRGVISLNELAMIGVVVFSIQIGILDAKMWWLYALVMGYMILMRLEFFVPKWLKAHQFWYNFSHMMIIPLVDLYSSGLDWQMQGITPHIGLVFFLLVSFMNGFVLEYGRKIRPPELEEEGYMTYTKIHGVRKAPKIWIGLLSITYLFSIAAAWYAGYHIWTYLILTLFLIASLIPAFLFLKNITPKNAKYIEYAASLWTLVMYLTLGAIPMIFN